MQADRERLIPMRPFHVLIYATNDAETSDGMTVAARSRFALSFEEVTERLALLEQMFVEPDGSFVWVAPKHATDRWQLDGNVYDQRGHVQYVELKGNCPAAELDILLHALGWPETRLVFQQLPEATLVDEPTFRRSLFSSRAVFR